MTTFNFSGLTAGAWSDANFSSGAGIKVAAQTANGALSALAWSSGAVSRAMLTGRTWSNVITAQVTVNGVGGHAVSDDECNVAIIVETGASQWFGYYVRLQATSQILIRQDDSTGVPGQTGTHTLLGTPATATMAEGDTFTLSYTKSTGALALLHNATSIITATDATYNTGVTAGIVLDDNNHGGTGISSLVTTGDSVGATTTLNQIESRSMRGMNRGCMRGMS